MGAWEKLAVGWEMCARFGFDAGKINDRVKLVDLSGADNERLGRLLQAQVIGPCVESIVGDFMQSLQRIEQFNTTVEDTSRLATLLQQYLNTFGTNVESFDYFEQRLRIGCAHHRMRVPQPVYQSAYRSLEFELIRNIPGEIRADQEIFESLVRFILKVIALDMTLAIESYCKSVTIGLEDTLQTERGETERLRQLSITDSLTDLHNHGFLRHLLLDKLEAALAGGKPLCVIMGDLDNFKQINDLHGHLVGDHVLRIAATRMVAAARSGDEIGRYGGEEFLFVLENTSLDEAAEVAERIRSRIDGDSIHYQATSIHASMSIGIAQARAGDSVDDLIARADAALYAAKLSGRNCVMLQKAG
jgi:diguanylate cyclase (GGDEF)-like protein